jgi:hypothetical protein
MEEEKYSFANHISHPPKFLYASLDRMRMIATTMTLQTRSQLASVRFKLRGERGRYLRAVEPGEEATRR